MKEKYANKKPYGKWLEAQVATLPELVESVPEHLLKVPTIQSGHSPIDAVPVSPSSAEANGSSNESSNGSSNGSSSGSNGSSSGSNGTLSSRQEGGQVGVNASNGHSNPGAGTHSCSTGFSMSHITRAQSLLVTVVHATVLCVLQSCVRPHCSSSVAQTSNVTLVTPFCSVLALQLPSLPACGLHTCIPCDCQPDAMLQANIPAVQHCSSLTSVVYEQEKVEA